MSLRESIPDAIPTQILVTLRVHPSGQTDALVEGPDQDEWPLISAADPVTAACEWLQALCDALEQVDMADEFAVLVETMQEVGMRGGEIRFQREAYP